MPDFYAQLKKFKIGAIGWDFDATALSYGTFEDTNIKSYQQFHTEYVRKMSPDFVSAVKRVHKMKIAQGITTFNDDLFNTVLRKKKQMTYIVGGNALIRPVLTELFPDFHQKMEIYALNPEKHDMHAPDRFRKIGMNKNWHLSCMAKRYKVKKEQILLVDDDYENVVAARKAKYRAVFVSGDKGFDFKDCVIK
jgi:hypothetical protein